MRRQSSSYANDWLANVRWGYVTLRTSRPYKKAGSGLGERIEYDAGARDDVAFLASYQQQVARRIGMSERRWRDIAKERTVPRGTTAERITRIATEYRLTSQARS